MRGPDLVGELRRRLQHRLRIADGVAVGVALLVLGPALGPGFVLLRDMVFVPDPAFAARLPVWRETLRRFRVTAGRLAVILPAQIVQKVP